MSAPAIRLLLVDDHAAFRQPLAFMLEREPGITVVAQTASLAEARAAMPGAHGWFDVAIVDLQLPDGDGITLLAELQAAHPDAHSLVLTANTDKVQHARALEAGATGVMSKTAELKEIIAAVRRVYAGDCIHSSQDVIQMLRLAGQERERDREAQVLLSRLTPRELQVLTALVEGLDNKAIAERLYISPETARTHVVKLLAKLNAESRLQAAIFAIRQGIGSTN
jgi:DNA-binding NarL/FixJ family response regulator